MVVYKCTYNYNYQYKPTSACALTNAPCSPVNWKCTPTPVDPVPAGAFQFPPPRAGSLTLHRSVVSPCDFPLFLHFEHYEYCR